ncbi:MAG: CPBP family intramembrane metalloprotease [Clostridiales bacterium]|nr:CPBP family intramembrane metalloprotease [Clostridiales bacterium]
MEIVFLRKDLRKCYGRAMICVFCILLFTQLFAAAAYGLYEWVAVPLLLRRGIAPGYAGLLLVNDISVYLPPLVIIPLVLRKMPRTEKPAPHPLPLRELAIAIPFCIGTLYLFAYVTSGLIAVIEALSGVETSNILDSLDGIPLGLYAFTTVVVAPICEEFLFRRLFLNRCRALGEVSAILLSATGFALMHQNFYQLLYAFALGVVLGSVAILTGRLRECILLHACTNAVSVLLSLPVSDEVYAFLGLALLACIVFTVYIFFKRYRYYSFDPGPLPYDGATKRRMCLRSPCFWICGLLSLAASVATIFI